MIFNCIYVCLAGETNKFLGNCNIGEKILNLELLSERNQIPIFVPNANHSSWHAVGPQ